EPLARDDVRRQSGDLLAAEADPSLGPDVAHDRLDRGGPPDAVAAEQAHDLTLGHLEVHALQDVTLAVERVELGDVEHRHGPGLPEGGGVSPAALLRHAEIR